MPAQINVLVEAGLPLDGVAYRLTHHFLAEPASSAIRVIYELAGRPRRFRGLRQALSAPSDSTVTVALRTLRDEGVIDQRLDAAARPPTFSTS